MPRCIECNTVVDRIVQPENEVVEKCTTCHRWCDRYYEFTGCQKVISVILLERSAWIHVLFNRREIRSSLFFTALLSCMIESYVVCITTVFRTLRAMDAYKPLSLIANVTSVETLQLFRNMDPKVGERLLHKTWPTIFVYACGEYALCLATATLLGLRSHPRSGATVWECVLTWMTCVNLAYSAKLCFVVFL
ncbi:unnamed protein product, partial [Trypanosoma congolense IL3000]